MPHEKGFAISAMAAAALLAPAAVRATAAERSCEGIEGPHGIMYYDPFMIFFDHDSAAITAAASQTLEHVAATYRPLTHCRLMVAGYSDRTGSAAYNLALSRRRAEAAVADLRRRGVLAVPEIQAVGEARPLVETEDGVAEFQNRRAEILIGPRDGY